MHEGIEPRGPIYFTASICIPWLHQPRASLNIDPLGTKHKQPRFQRGFFVFGVQGLVESHRCGSTDCEAISNERDSAKPEGDKQA